MEGILRSLGMETILGRFQAQRMELHTTLAACDQELVRLGVSTIGDRIRLRDTCKRKVEEDTPSTSQVSGAREERLSIFNPRRHNNRCKCKNLYAFILASQVTIHTRFALYVFLYWHKTV